MADIKTVAMEAGQENTLEEIYQDLIAQGFSPREAAKKAKELRSFIERLVSYAKKNNLHGRRLIQKKIKGNLFISFPILANYV